VLPGIAAAPIFALAFRQIVLLLPAAASGKGFSVTVALFDLVHPVAVMVSVIVYIAVTVGVTEGLAKVDTNPAGSDVQL
jgi:hypothetical protein